MFKKSIQTVIVIFVVSTSCNPKIKTASDVVDAHLNATVLEKADWADFKAQKSYLNFKIKMGGNLVNSVEQVVSTKGTSYQKTETYQDAVLAETLLTNPNSSYMIKFEKGRFVGMNNFPAQAISLMPVSDFQKLKSDFNLKDTIWSGKPVYQLVSESSGEEYMFDKDSKYLIAIISKSMYGRSETTFSDHRAVSGYILPFRIVTVIPGSGFESELNFSKIEVNPVFSTSEFELDSTWKRLSKGQKIPDFEIPYAENQDKKFSSKDLKGKVTLIDFWATWCKPCLEEFPAIKESYAAYSDRGFEVISISLEKDRQRLMAYLDKNPFPWDYTLYSAGELKSQLAIDFQIVALPRQLLIDEKGTIIAMDLDLREGRLNNVLKDLLDN
ncbi:MAG: TlpA family protein disulfide reductase [Bacteroidetes bacterium]|nr:TlpA family protein disulfide reductase [Bacteroidota bacterium]